MQEDAATWNGDDWLNRCAWCARVIPPDREVLVVKSRLPVEMAELLGPSGNVQPLPLANSNKTVALILPANDSDARREGVAAVFQVCCKKCAAALEDALQKENPLASSELSHPGAVPKSLPHSALPSMEIMMRKMQRLIRKEVLDSPEEINALMAKVCASPELLDGEPPTPLEEAQEIVDQARQASSGKRRRKLARRALEVCPDCSDAYLLLAGDADDAVSAKDFYEKAVRAAERAMGAEAFEEFAGHFWGYIETRPYMRARASLAQFLWEMGERAAAIGHYRELLELNPNDNQGNRFLLVDWLLAEGRNEDAGKLLKSYPEDIAAAWAYSRALWLFRQEGPGPKAKKALRRALKANPFVPAYLLDDEPLPPDPPTWIGLGDENEAVDYAARGIENWEQTPYALDWLREEDSKFAA